MKVSVNIKMDEELRDSAKLLFSKMGLDMTTAVNMFLIQSLRIKGIPFELKIDSEGDVNGWDKKSKEGI